MGLLETFREEVQDYLRRSGMSPTAFGQSAVGDPNFVFDLREGREPRLSTIDKVRQFMAATNGAAA